MRLVRGLALGLVLLVVALGRPAWSGVTVQELTSPGGQPFWLVEEPSIPIVAVELSFRGGSWLDPEGREGLARLTMSLLEEGAGDLDAVAFETRASEISARMGFSAGRDTSSVSARFLTDTLDEGIDLLVLALTQPRFDPEPVERVRRQILSGIAQGETDPDTIMRRAWAERAYPGHPYSRRSSGTVDSVQAIAASDIAAMHARLLTREGTHVAIVGAISADKAAEIVDRLIGGLPADGSAEVPDVETDPPVGIHVIQEAVPQSVALLGHRGLRRTDPDYIPAFVMNHILGGGGFSSRLTQEVRVKRGLAYGVYSYLTESEGSELIMASVSTENARISESIQVIKDEWARMAAEGATPEELSAAKTYLTGSFPLRFDSNAKIAGFLIFLQREGLGSDYIERRNGLIEAVTVEDIARVAERLLKPEALSVVVVGMPEGL